MTNFTLCTAQFADAPRSNCVERTLHLIDVENLLGGPHGTKADAARVHAAYESVAPYRSTADQMIIASSHHAAKHQWFAWPPGARRLVRSGPDGADLELLNVLETEHVHRRFDHVVIGSGDGIFAFPAAALQAAGCGVTVVSRQDSLSRELGFAVRDIRCIEDSVAVHALRGA